eukprot:TRINITY_DN1406_c0_g1_i1.p1 TRINITY_DN1406_c0_g1~~TRINITY_DN1406_c0_g1_i1.p1  ORF type:complete len:159 (-),score=36.68 TRINITY_DN1406_c0_g1_i1:113-589(-)
MATTTGRYTGLEEPYEKSGWRFRDYVVLAIWLGFLATIGTVVTAATVIGGGGLLLVGTPLLLLFSPILVPGGIILAIVTGGGLALAVATAAGIGLLVWVYNYFTGQHVGAETFETLTGKTKEFTSKGIDTLQHATGYAKEQAGATAGQLAGGGSGRTF